MRLRPALLLISILLAAGCGGGGEIKHATQPNGPPQPPPPPPERLDTASKKTKAIQTVVAFAKAKYKNALTYEGANAQFLEPKKIGGEHHDDGTVAKTIDSGVPLGSWRVSIPVARPKQDNDASSLVGIASPDQLPTGGVLARIFMLTPDGQVTEGEPIMAPPPIFHAPSP